ncbi:MAG: GxxExxY protein [Acidobacteriota bacterium]|nr:GxxExxY protein [Acidobacteriota bacterium]
MKYGTTSPGSRSEGLIYKQECFDIVGAAIQVHRTLSPGFSEPIYQESLEIELAHRKIPNVPHQRMSILYRDQELESYFKPDFVCYNKIIVEIKALKNLSNLEISQTLNYLKISNFRLGILINFGSYGKLEWKRIVL